MWYLIALWLLGGNVSDQQPAVKPVVSGPPLEPVHVVEPIDPRTLAEVEEDLTIANQVVAMERAAYVRAWPSRVIDNLCDDRPEYVRARDWLLDEWAAIHRSQ